MKRGDKDLAAKLIFAIMLAFCAVVVNLIP